MNLRGALYVSALLATASAINVAQTTTTTPNPAAVPSPQTPATATSPASPPRDPTPPASQTTAPPPTQSAPTPASNQTPSQTMAPASASPAGTAPAPNGNQTATPANSSATFGNLNQGGLTSDQLQQRIDSALHSEPTLSGSNLTVNVADDAIDLSGTVGTAKERLTARRIVQSFAGNRRVRERVTVSGGGARSNEPSGTGAKQNQESSGKVEEKNLNRPITNPARDGDKSEDPR